MLNESPTSTILENDDEFIIKEYYLITVMIAYTDGKTFKFFNFLYVFFEMQY